MKTILFLIATFTINTVLAQGAFVDAYVVKQSKDTLRGKIKFNDWENNPTEIEFQSSTNETSIFEPTQISSFCILSKNEIYVSKTLNLNYIRQAEIAEDGKALLESKVEDIFLRLLLKGDKASLFQLIDRDNRIRFFVEKDNQTNELIYYTYQKMVDVNGNKQNRKFTNETYKQQIWMICQDAPKKFSDDDPIYAQTPMMLFFEKYNACFLGDKINYVSKKDKVNIGLLGRLGVWNNNLLSDKINPFWGISVQITEPRKHQRRFARVEYHLYPSESYEVAIIRKNKIIDRKYFDLSLLGGSYLGKGKLQPYLYVGLRFFNSAAIPLYGGGGISYKRNFHFEYSGNVIHSNFFSICYQYSFKPKK